VEINFQQQIIGYSLDDRKHGLLRYDKGEFIIISPSSYFFKPMENLKPVEVLFRDIVQMITRGYNFIFLEESYENFLFYCRNIKIYLPEFYLVKNIGNIDYDLIRNKFINIGFTNPSCEVALICCDIFQNHPVFIHYKQLYNYLVTSKN